MSGQEGRIRVLIVDGQAEVRRGLRMRLAVEPDIAVVGETGDATQATALARALRPDAIVVGIQASAVNGMGPITRLRVAAPAAALVVLALYGDGEARERAREAGARAFLEMGGQAADLPQVLRQVASGRLRQTGCAAMGG